MTNLMKILGKNYDEYVRTRAAVYRNSLSGKTLGFLLTELPTSPAWVFIKVEPLPALKNSTVYDKLKRLNEGKYGAKYVDGQVYGV